MAVATASRAASVLLGLAAALWLPAGPALGVAATQPAAAAQQGPLHIRARSTRPVTFGPLITDTAVPAPPGSIALQLGWELRLRDGRFDADWNKDELQQGFISLTLPLQLTVGLPHDVEACLVTPYVPNWAYDLEGAAPDDQADAGGLGDFSLMIKHRVLRERTLHPTLSALLTVGFPVGHHFPASPERGGVDQLGRGAFSFTLGLNASQHVVPLLPGVEYVANSRLSFALGLAIDLAGRNVPLNYTTLLSRIVAP